MKTLEAGQPDTAGGSPTSIDTGDHHHQSLGFRVIATGTGSTTTNSASKLYRFTVSRLVHKRPKRPPPEVLQDHRRYLT